MKPILKKTFGLFRGVALVALGVSSFTSASTAGVLNLYTGRHYKADEEINKLFTEKTGIEVKVVNAPPDQLIERLKSEGANSPADLLITVDAGRMQFAQKAGLLQPFKSEALNKATPPNLRDVNGTWYPFAVRARVIMVAADRVKEGAIKNYEDLADPKWRGKLLIRSSSNAYNQSLVASILAANGESATRTWVKGIVANLARPPQGGDRDQIKAVADGLADVCVSNTYYLALLANSKDEAERKQAAGIRVIYPNQDGRGTHVNVGAAGLVKTAKNVDNARKYVEFLLSPEIQKLIANSTYEYPVNFDLNLNPQHKQWGAFKTDVETFRKMEEFQSKVGEIFDAEGWK